MKTMLVILRWVAGDIKGEIWGQISIIVDRKMKTERMKSRFGHF